MNSGFIKFIKDYLVYCLFITFIFVAYVYTFDSHIHTKYAIKDISNLKGKKDGYYITNNDLGNNSAPNSKSNPGENDDFNPQKELDGNYNTYNTIYESNDVIVYRFKMVMKTIFDARLFTPRYLTLYYLTPSFSSILNGPQEEYYILEKKLRI